MKSLFPLAAVLATLSACSGQGAADKPAKPADKGMPQIEVVTFGLASSDPGERLYGSKCAYCHVGKNTGAIMLKKRLAPSQPAELHLRTDLDADYVTTVVRHGLVNMPPLTRAELSDEQLATIATWLARKDRK
ncbi:MAG: c-type cytochrome [Sphingomonadales bacterium]|nr:c-type cytochrome [Sphingomonadales bacterium]MBD3772602.1 c-type cytochrome [Paracoccaceae bacterium]